MEVSEYHAFAIQGRLYPQTIPEEALSYTALGLNGEAGEVAEKIKKYLRDNHLVAADVIKELGDVLWYLTNMADHLEYTLEDVMRMNMEKLTSRRERDQVRGSGDDR